jgi:hypothetical protein
VVTPIHPDSREDAPIVVKIDQVDNILDEVQRYESNVKHVLPLQTARLEDNPTTPEASGLAGIKYTLVANSDDVPQDLRERVHTQGADGLGTLIRKQLFTQFSKTWWRQRHAFRFQAWKEYDWLLPPLLILDSMPEGEIPENSHLIKFPFNRARLKTLLKEVQFGDMVVVENFTIQRVDRENNLLKLAVGYGSEADKRAYKIEVKGLNPSKSYYRGETVERLFGKVWKTRHDILVDAARALEPDFDLNAHWISLVRNRIPNPLLAYEDLLDRHVNGSLSKIHGDLHLGNILVGPNNSIWLIDFAHTRDGHTLFDWASLEISLLGDAVMGVAGDEWSAARKIASQLAALNTAMATSSTGGERLAAMASIVTIREIVRECLAETNNWYEYYVALTLCSLRAITWPLMPLGGRRLMFLLSGLSIHELNRKFQGGSSTDTPPVDESDLTDHLPNSVSWEGQGDTPGHAETLGSGQAVAVPKLDLPSPEEREIQPLPPAIPLEEGDAASFPEETAPSVQPHEGERTIGSDPL